MDKFEPLAQFLPVSLHYPTQKAEGDATFVRSAPSMHYGTEKSVCYRPSKPISKIFPVAPHE